MKGFINIIKPKGVSSAYAVGGVKKKVSCPCGHMGTLDPMAEGVLPVGIGKTSRLFPFILDKEKTYIAEFKFGILTDTLDITGETIKTSDVIPSEEDLIKALPSFVGEIDQIPPKYSAKCVNGKRGYQLARNGVEFSLEPKRVCVLSFELLERTGTDTFTFKIRCKGGTYIRSLARDLGEKCNTFSVMSKLIRSESGIFNYSNGVGLEEFKSSTDIEKYIIPADSVIDYEKLILTPRQADRLINGVYEEYGFKDGIYRVYNGQEFWGVGEVNGGILKMKAYVR